MTTLEEVLGYINNFFIVGERRGKYTIEGGTITLDFLQENQYYKIEGSIFNDGVHKYASTEQLTDEEFRGKILPMAVPQAVIAISEEVAAWETKYGDAQNSPYTSESFGGYSYSKSQGYGRTGTNSNISWRTIFASKLNRWRKI